MLKKTIPYALALLVAACAPQPAATSNAGMKMPCCEKCACCKSGQCNCCKDGSCPMCQGMKDGMSCMKNSEECPICAKAEREWQAKQGTVKH